MTEVLTIDTAELGDRSYLIHDGKVAVVVDPQRDVDRVLSVANSAGVDIACVAETHLHNDYVSGGKDLAERTGAKHLLAGGDEVAFSCVPVSGGEQFHFGELELEVLATPGHTPHHVSYVVGSSGGTSKVFTGGSLLFGTVGRTDLVGRQHTEHLTREQYRSVHHLADELSEDVAVFPTHGFGSFCSSTATSGVDSSTIGDERHHNIAFQVLGEDDFVEVLLARLTAYPRYYAHMGGINRAGPGPIDLSPPKRLDPEELRERIREGGWVVDLRDRRAFAASHVPYTISVEGGTSFSTYLGWAIPWGTPVTLVGESPQQVAKAQRDLVRIGIDRLAGAAVGSTDELASDGVASYPVSDFSGLRDVLTAGREVSVLDVRADDEWEQGRLNGAQHIPFFELEERMAEVGKEDEVWVYCASGFRASMASSLLARAGRRPVLVDDRWEEAGKAGLTVVS